MECQSLRSCARSQSPLHVYIEAGGGGVPHTTYYGYSEDSTTSRGEYHSEIRIAQAGGGGVGGGRWCWR